MTNKITSESINNLLTVGPDTLAHEFYRSNPIACNKLSNIIYGNYVPDDSDINLKFYNVIPLKKFISLITDESIVDVSTESCTCQPPIFEAFQENVDPFEYYKIIVTVQNSNGDVKTTELISYLNSLCTKFANKYDLFFYPVITLDTKEFYVYYEEQTTLIIEE